MENQYHINFFQDKKSLIRELKDIPLYAPISDNSSSFNSLAFGYNHPIFNAISGDELAQIFEAIPPCITSVYLSQNNLGLKLPTATLAQALEAIPTTVTSLYLDNNELAAFNGSQLTQILRAIPISITSLDLGCNKLGNLHGSELAEAFKAIPTKVASLDLRDNNLHRLPGDQLARAFESIPTWLTSLDLRNNALCLISNDTLVSILKAFPIGINTINFNDLFFINEISLETLQTLFHRLPQIETVYLNYGKLSKMDDSRRQALKNLFPNLKNTIFVDNDNNKLGIYLQDTKPTQTKSPLAQSTLAKRLQFPSGQTVPSLQHLAAFFIKSRMTPKEREYDMLAQDSRFDQLGKSSIMRV